VPSSGQILPQSAMKLRYYLTDISRGLGYLTGINNERFKSALRNVPAGLKPLRPDAERQPRQNECGRHRRCFFLFCFIFFKISPV
jgi:hypothetical protein